MIPQGNGHLKEAIIHLGREPRSKSANRGWPIYPVGLCGRGVFLRNQKLARVDILVAGGHDQSSAKNVDRDR